MHRSAMLSGMETGIGGAIVIVVSGASANAPSRHHYSASINNMEIMVDELSTQSRAEHEGAKLLRSWVRSGWWLFFETLKILDIFSKTCKRTFVEESVRSYGRRISHFTDQSRSLQKCIYILPWSIIGRKALSDTANAKLYRRTCAVGEGVAGLEERWKCW